jgi:DNA processing protein
MHDKSSLAAEEVAALGLWCVPGLSRVHIDLLRTHFGSCESALRTPVGALIAAGLPEELAAQTTDDGPLRLAEAALESCRALGAWVLLPHHAGWPSGMEWVVQRPGALFGIGALPTGPAAAVVGSRMVDLYGREFARSLGSDLAGAGVCVVSGGALGVDGSAHAGALATGAVESTLAVLAAGLDHLYPHQHVRLFERIAEQGCLLTEFPPGVFPLRRHFPRRNRLLSALSQAVVVVRAAPRSGSLSTARHAFALGIPVLAVPGPAGDALSRGTNQLLRQGALVCEGPSDVFAVLDMKPRPDDSPRSIRRARPTLPAREHRLFEALGAVPAAVDDLYREARLSASAGAAALTLLELHGLAERTPGNRFQRSRTTWGDA